MRGELSEGSIRLAGLRNRGCEKPGLTIHEKNSRLMRHLVAQLIAG